MGSEKEKLKTLWVSWENTMNGIQEHIQWIFQWIYSEVDLPLNKLNSKCILEPIWHCVFVIRSVTDQNPA